MTQANPELSTPSVLSATDYRNRARRKATRLSYASGARVYEGWCARRALEPYPVALEPLCDFLVDLAQTRKLATLVSRLAAVKHAAKIRGQRIDTQEPMIADLLRGLKQVHAAPQRQAAAFMLEDVKALIAVCGDDYVGRRDRAIILVGFAGALRRSELVVLDVEHLAWEPDQVTLRLPITKESKGADVVIPKGDHAETCPLVALKAWLEEAVIVSGPLFRRSRSCAIMRSVRLNDRTIARIIQKRAAQAGLVGTDENPITAHGLRAGFITSAYKAGATDIDIMHHVRHRNPQTMRGYVRRPRIGNKSPASIIGL